MSKKKKSEKLTKYENQLLDEHFEKMKFTNNLINSFSPHVPIEILSSHVHGSDKEIDEERLAKEEKPMPNPLSPLPTLSVEQIQEKCLEIYKNTKEGMDGNTVIHFIKRIQAWDNDVFDMGETIVKAKILGEEQEAVIYFGEGTEFNVGIYIGSEKNEKKKQAFAVVKEISGDETYFELEEYHQLTISIHSKAKESEVGIFTSFSKNTEELHLGIIDGYPNLKPIKHILYHDCVNLKNDKYPKLSYNKETTKAIENGKGESK